MFDLEMNIKAWSDYLRTRGTLAEADVVELESHLRDQIDDLTSSGLNAEEAFLISVKRLGSVSHISEEFAKVNTESLWKQLLLDPIDPAEKARHQRSILLVILLALLAGTAARIPVLFGIKVGSLTYLKNLSFYILPFIAFFLAMRSGAPVKLRGVLAGIFALTLVVVNLYPSYEPYHTEALSAIHLPILLWFVTGAAYMGRGWQTSRARMDFLRLGRERDLRQPAPARTDRPDRVLPDHLPNHRR